MRSLGLVLPLLLCMPVLGGNCADGKCQVTPQAVYQVVPQHLVVARPTVLVPVQPRQVLRRYQGPIWTRCFGRTRTIYVSQ